MYTWLDDDPVSKMLRYIWKQLKLELPNSNLKLFLTWLVIMLSKSSLI